MALYLVKESETAAPALVRARNGDAARDLAGFPDGWVSRVTEDGPAGVLVDAICASPPPEPDTDDDSQPEPPLTLDAPAGGGRGGARKARRRSR